MPLWLSPSGFWSSPTTTATTTSGCYSLLGNTSTAATASNNTIYVHAAWYNNQFQDQRTVAWASANNVSSWSIDPQETVTRPRLRRPAQYGLAEARRHHELTERYARAAEAERAADHLEWRATAIQAHTDGAKQRALDLLLEHLTPAQRETFHKNSWFIVEGRSMRQYRIHARGSLVANVDVLDSKMKTIHRLCAHCDLHTIPLGDQLLAQKLMLEFDEDAFLQIANRHAA
jgi:hypothetical protein